MAKLIGDSTLLELWGSVGTVLTPPNQKILAGWIKGDQPPYEWMNWFYNTFCGKLNHILTHGVPIWTEQTAYPSGAVVTYSGHVYIALTPNQNIEPVADSLTWKDVLAGGDIEPVILIEQPTILSPIQGSTNNIGIIEVSAYSTSDMFDGPANALIWQVARDSEFTNIYLQGELLNPTSTPEIEYQAESEQLYYARVRYRSGAILSQFSETVSYTTQPLTVNQPTITVDGQPVSVGETPVATISAFVSSPEGALTYANSNIILTNNTLSAEVVNEVTDISATWTYALPTLSPDTSYTLEVRHNSTSAISSSYASNTFSTLVSFAADILVVAGHESSSSPRNLTFSMGRRDLLDLVSYPFSIGSYDTDNIAFSLHTCKTNHYIAVGHSNAGPRVQIFRYLRATNEMVKISFSDAAITGTPSRIAFSDDGKFMAIGDAGGNSWQARIYEIDSVNNTFTFRSEANISLTSRAPQTLQFSSQHNYLVMGLVNTPRVLWFKINQTTGVATQLDPPSGGFHDTASRAVINHASNEMAVLHDPVSNRNLTIYTINTGNDTLAQRQEFIAPLVNSQPYTLAYTPNDRFLLTATKDKILRVYDAQDNYRFLSSIATLPGSTVIEIRIHKDSDMVVVAYSGNTTLDIYSLNPVTGATVQLNYDTNAISQFRSCADWMYLT